MRVSCSHEVGDNAFLDEGCSLIHRYEIEYSSNDSEPVERSVYNVVISNPRARTWCERVSYRIKVYWGSCTSVRDGSLDVDLSSGEQAIR